MARDHRPGITAIADNTVVRSDQGWDGGLWTLTTDAVMDTTQTHVLPGVLFVLSWDRRTDNLSLIFIHQMIASDGWWLTVVWSQVIPRQDSEMTRAPLWYFLSSLSRVSDLHERFLSLSWNRLTGKLSKQKYTDTQIIFWSKGCYFCNAHAHPSFLKLLPSRTSVKSLYQHAT